MCRKLFLSALAVLCCLTIAAQSNSASSSKTFEGLVVDESGEPLIGVSLLITGTQNGTFTDVDGRFVFEQPHFPLNLTVSYIGFEDQNITLTGKEAQPYTLTMGASASALDEVVVVGYGTQKKSSLSGAVAIVSGKEINSRPVVSAANALQGADPSMNISFGTGSPEGGYNLNIRGTISLNGGSPLVLADGVEVELSQINPNDIESVSVLKDASSCAIYGAKASAGVVLITTKQGKRGDNATVTYSGRMGWQSNTTTTDFITTGYDHVTLVNEFMNNSSDGVRTIWTYTNENGGLQKLLERRNDKVEDPSRPWVEVADNGNYMYYGNFDWYGYLYRRVRPQTEHNVSISGGSEKISYYASARYLYQKGMFNVADDTYHDFSTRAKVSAKVKDWLKYSTNISYRRNEYTYGGYYNYEGTISALQANITPAVLPVNPDGTTVQYVNQLGKNSPLGSGRAGLLTSKVANNNKSHSYFTMTHSLDFYIVEPFFITATYDYREQNGLNKYRNNTFPYSRKQDVIETFSSGSSRNYYEEVTSGYRGHSVNIYGTFQKSFGEHNVKVVAGGQWEKYRKVSTTVSQEGLTADDLSSFAVAEGVISPIEQSINSYQTLGFFARANYDWANRYIVEASIRADGSSRFAPSSRWGWFPSASAAWRLSEEPFYKPIKDVMNDAKVRFSLGSLGNQQVDYYSYMDLISAGNEFDYTFDGQNKATYSSVSAPKSSNLTWETITTYDLGVDLAFLGSRLKLVADGYIRDTKNMLTYSLTLPDSYGASSPKENCADLRTTGWEISLSWNDSFKLAGSEFRYNASATLGDYLTKITRYHNPDGILPTYNGYSSASSNYYVGMTLGEIWGFPVDGLFKTDHEAAVYQSSVDDRLVNNRVYQGKGPAGAYLRAGDVRFKDVNGDGVISRGAGTLADHGDLTVIGNSLPRYNYSFRLGFSWYGFDISAFFQGVGHRDWYPPDGQTSYDFWGPYAFPPTSFISKNFAANVWTEDNRNAYFPRARGYEAYSGGSLGTVNDRYLQNLAYLRFKNLTIGYSLPEKWMKAIKFQQIRVYFTGENICYWSPLKKYCDTMDPEIAGTSGTSTNGSGVGYAYPRTFSVGVEIKF